MKYSIAKIKKTNLQDTFFGTYFYRKFATFFTYILARLPITPNQISFLSLITSILGAVLFSFGSYTFNVFAAILIQVGMILDYSDGQVARLKGLGSQRGAWLDVLVGMIQNNLIILGVAIGLTHSNNSQLTWILSFIVLFAWNMTCYVHLNAMIFFPKLELKSTDLAKNLKKGININPQFLSIGSDVYFVAIGVSALFSVLKEGLIFLSILGNLYWISIFIFIFIKQNVKK